MKFDWENWNIGGRLIFIATCLAIVSMFMKWVDIGIISQSGFSQLTFLFLIFWIYPVLMLFYNKPIHKLWGILCSIASFVVTIIYILSESVTFFDETANVAATGAYLFLFASIILLIGIIKYQPATVHNVESSIA